METESAHSALAQRVRQLELGMRIFALSVVIVLAFFNVRLALAVPKFQAIFNDMLNGHALPALTALVLASHSTLLSISFLLPILALGVAAMVRSGLFSLVAMAAIMVLSLLQLTVTSTALFLPLSDILQNMQGGGPP